MVFVTFYPPKQKHCYLLRRAKNNLFYPEIRVILNIQKKNLETLVTIGEGKAVIEFGEQISPKTSSYSEFLHKLEVYKKQ